MDLRTGKTNGARDLEPETNLLKGFYPGDHVDVEVIPWDWAINKQSGTKYYFVNISRSEVDAAK